MQSSKDSLPFLAQELDDYLKDDCWDMLLRNDYRLPSKNCHWLTKQVMIKIVKEEMYCPKYSDLIPRPCPRPPTKDLLIVEVNKEISMKYGASRTIIYTKTRMPDQAWLLDTLSALNPRHRFFNKDFDLVKRGDKKTWSNEVAFMKG